MELFAVILSVCVAYVSTAAVRTANNQLLLPNRQICKSGNMYYRDPNNCTCFYHCDTTYRAHYKCCLPGQFFSELISNCDWSDGEDCLQEHRMVGGTVDDETARTARQSSQCPEPNVAYPNSNDCKVYWDCATSVPVLRSCAHLSKFKGKVLEGVCNCPDFHVFSKIQEIRKRGNANPNTII